MNFTDGVEKVINDNDLPVITFYEFFVLGYHLFHKKALNGEPLKRLPHDWDQTRAKNALRRLEARKALVMDSDFRSGVWRVTQSTRAGSAEEAACIADPFAYVSHLSAMQRYGLTDRSPQPLERHYRVLDGLLQKRSDHHLGLIGTKRVPQSFAKSCGSANRVQGLREGMACRVRPTARAKIRSANVGIAATAALTGCAQPWRAFPPRAGRDTSP